MFSKTSVAVMAGMALAGSVLTVPGVVAAPTAGRAAAWGYNEYGQLGNNSTIDSSVPVAVKADSGPLAGKTITAISAGYEHSCAVAEGKAYCWGYNYSGQLGDNSAATSWVPVAVKADSGPLLGKTVTAIDAGGYHSCAVADGKAYCWGDNGDGRLGDNSAATSWVPVAVKADSGPLAGKMVTAITAGGSHSCAVADGKAYCWGDNLSGQLGDNTGPTDSEVPVAVKTDSGPLAGKTVTAITAGDNHSCAVADGKAYCWGDNLSGQLGDNTGPTDSKVPVAVKTDSGPLAGKMVTAITAGGSHSCAVADGKAYCWGDNLTGQLGDNTGPTDSKMPVAVKTDSGPLAGKTVTAIAAGGSHSCAVADGKAFCWGRNSYGRLGNSSTTDSKMPVAVNTDGPLAGKTVTMIGAGGSHSMVLAAAVPQPPTAVGGVPGDGQVSVSWAAPGDDGGSPVLDYAVTAVPGGGSCTNSGTSCVVSGLANSTAYTFTVTARNAIGISAPSGPSAPVAPKAATPSKVTGVKAVVKKGKVKITWKPVPAATSYRVRISKPGGKKYRAWKTTSKRVFKAKVRKGKKYRFQVAAVGAGRRGPVTTIRFKGK